MIIGSVLIFYRLEKCQAQYRQQWYSTFHIPFVYPVVALTAMSLAHSVSDMVTNAHIK